MPNSTNVAQAFAGMQWCILPEKMREIEAIVSRFEAGEKISNERAQELISQSAHVVDTARHEAAAGANVEIISVLGTIMNRASSMNMISGATTYSNVADRVNAAAANPKVSKIVLDLDTPGGTVVGVDQLASAIRAAKKVKPVIAVVNDMAASAGYWIASQATEIAVSGSSLVGSISVLSTHTDVSALESKLGVKTTMLATGEFKTLGNPHEPLSEKHKAKILDRMQATHDLFVATIADGRGMDVGTVKKLATGDTWNGGEAVANGLADYSATMEEVLSDSTKTQRTVSTPTATLPVPNETIQMPNDLNKEKATTETAAVVAPATADLASLQASVTDLAGAVTLLLGAQKATAEHAATERAQALVNPLIKSGAVSPADGAELIEQATVNYDVAASIIGKMNPTANAAVPFGNVVGAGPVNRQAHVSSEEAQVFEQLGLIDMNGNLTLENVTLPLDTNGAVTYNFASAQHQANRIDSHVKSLLGSWS